MSHIPYDTALVVGAGPGISAAVARALAASGIRVAVAARDVDTLRALAGEIGAVAFAVDTTDPAAVERLFVNVEAAIGVPEIVLYDAGGQVRRPSVAPDPEATQRAIEVSAFGGFLVTQQAASRLLPRGAGAILLTGASARGKGFAPTSSFAIGKFGLRGLAQSAARELSPKGIHVAHFMIDDAPCRSIRPAPDERPEGPLDPEAVARSYLAVLAQPRSAWTSEIDLRRWVDRFDRPGPPLARPRRRSRILRVS